MLPHFSGSAEPFIIFAKNVQFTLYPKSDVKSIFLQYIFFVLCKNNKNHAVNIFMSTKFLKGSIIYGCKSYSGV